MEIAKTELDAIEALVDHARDVKELAELDLSLIGGGVGDVVFC
jgi:hypothetical protein